MIAEGLMPESRTTMLNTYPRALTEGLSLSIRDLADQTWFDLVDPTEAERSAFERASGLRVPSKNELGEIEATSRLQVKNDALYMTAPMIFARRTSRGFRHRSALRYPNSC
jgi:Mg2+ and Co2+ transporter CorA